MACFGAIGTCSTAMYSATRRGGGCGQRIAVLLGPLTSEREPRWQAPKRTPGTEERRAPLLLDRPEQLVPIVVVHDASNVHPWAAESESAIGLLPSSTADALNPGELRAITGRLRPLQRALMIRSKTSLRRDTAGRAKRSRCGGLGRIGARCPSGAPRSPAADRDAPGARHQSGGRSLPGGRRGRSLRPSQSRTGTAGGGEYSCS